MRAELSEYERYIRTDELLGLQKQPEERVNHDELLFQVTHQASELWMKAVRADVGEAARLMRAAAGAVPVETATHSYPPLDRAAHLLRRSAMLIRSLGEQIGILKEMHPSDYHGIRLVLGAGSGQDSPGFQGIAHEAPALWQAFQGLLTLHGVTPIALLEEPDREYALFQLMQGLMSVDEAFGGFRYSHMVLARRIIGLDVMGTGGTNARYLEYGARATLFKELWDAVSQLTNRLNITYGKEGGR